MINREKYPLLGAALDAKDAGNPEHARDLMRTAGAVGTPAEKTALAKADQLIAEVNGQP